MKTETFNRQAPIAIAAIGVHMVERGLPAPMSIDLYASAETKKIRLMLTGGPDAQRAWLDSVEILSEDTTEVAHPSIGIRSAWIVRLPDSGFEVELIGYRAVPFLTAVPA